MLMPAGMASAQAAGCIVEDAAQAALDRQLAIIEETAVDVEEIFTGPESCINGDLLSSFDLSNLIPDLSGLMTGSITDAISSQIANARTQVCAAINDSIADAIGGVQSAITDQSSQLSQELRTILDDGWNVEI